MIYGSEEWNLLLDTARRKAARYGVRYAVVAQRWSWTNGPSGWHYVVVPAHVAWIARKG